MAEPTLAEERFAPGCKIKVEDKPLPDEVAIDVLDATVNDYVEGSSTFSLTVNVWTSDGQEYKYIDTGPFEKGAKVEILIGFVDAYESLIIGEITGLEPEFPAQESPVLRVQGMDLLHKYRRGRRTESFVKMKDSEIAAKVARRLNLSAQIDDTQVVHEYVMQNNQTDIDFLAERARRIDYELSFVDGEILCFRRAANYRDEVVTLEYGLTLKAFTPRLSLAKQVSEVMVQGWSSMSKEVIRASAKSGDLNKKMGEGQAGPAASASALSSSQGIVTNTPVCSEGEAQQISRAQINETARQYVTGQATAVGNTKVRAGRVVRLEKLGKTFSGPYYVKSSTHTVDASGYSTSFSVERNAT